MRKSSYGGPWTKVCGPASLLKCEEALKDMVRGKILHVSKNATYTDGWTWTIVEDNVKTT